MFIALSNLLRRRLGVQGWSSNKTIAISTNFRRSMKVEKKKNLRTFLISCTMNSKRNLFLLLCCVCAPEKRFWVIWARGTVHFFAQISESHFRSCLYFDTLLWSRHFQGKISAQKKYCLESDVIKAIRNSAVFR